METSDDWSRLPRFYVPSHNPNTNRQLAIKLTVPELFDPKLKNDRLTLLLEIDNGPSLHVYELIFWLCDTISDRLGQNTADLFPMTNLWGLFLPFSQPSSTHTSPLDWIGSIVRKYSSKSKTGGIWLSRKSAFKHYQLPLFSRDDSLACESICWVCMEFRRVPSASSTPSRTRVDEETIFKSRYDIQRTMLQAHNPRHLRSNASSSSTAERVRPTLAVPSPVLAVSEATAPFASAGLSLTDSLTSLLPTPSLASSSISASGESVLVVQRTRSNRVIGDIQHKRKGHSDRNRQQAFRNMRFHRLLFRRRALAKAQETDLLDRMEQSRDSMPAAGSNRIYFASELGGSEWPAAFQLCQIIRAHSENDDLSQEDCKTAITRCRFLPSTTVDTSHSPARKACRFSTQGSRVIIVSAGGDKLCFTDCKVGQVIKRFRCPGESFLALAVTVTAEQKTLVAAAGKQGTVKIIDYEASDCFRILQTENSGQPVLDLCFSYPLLLAGTGETAYVWDLSQESHVTSPLLKLVYTERPLHQAEVAAVSFSSLGDDQLFAIGVGRSEPNFLAVWDLSSWSSRRSNTNFHGQATEMQKLTALFQSDHFLASSISAIDNELFVLHTQPNRTLSIINIDFERKQTEVVIGELSHLPETKIRTYHSLVAHFGDHVRLFVGDGLGCLETFNLNNIIAEPSANRPDEIIYHHQSLGFILDVALSPCKAYLVGASSDNCLFIWKWDALDVGQSQPVGKAFQQERQNSVTPSSIFSSEHDHSDSQSDGEGHSDEDFVWNEVFGVQTLPSTFSSIQNVIFQPPRSYRPLRTEDVSSGFSDQDFFDFSDEQLSPGAITQPLVGPRPQRAGEGSDRISDSDSLDDDIFEQRF